LGIDISAFPALELPGVTLFGGGLTAVSTW